MVRKKISYLPALTTDLGCRGTEVSLSGAPDAKFTKSRSPLCCGEKSSQTRRGQPLMGNLLIRPSQRHVHFNIHGNSQWPQFWDNALYLSISFSVYVAQTQSLFGACCLRTLLHPRHYLDSVHSDFNNMLFVQYVDRESRYNMWSRVKALLSHTIKLCLSAFWCQSVVYSIFLVPHHKNQLQSEAKTKSKAIKLWSITPQQQSERPFNCLVTILSYYIVAFSLLK